MISLITYNCQTSQICRLKIHSPQYCSDRAIPNVLILQNNTKTSFSIHRLQVWSKLTRHHNIVVVNNHWYSGIRPQKKTILATFTTIFGEYQQSSILRSCFLTYTYLIYFKLFPKLILSCFNFITRLNNAYYFRRFSVDRYDTGHWCLVSREGPKDLRRQS